MADRSSTLDEAAALLADVKALRAAVAAEGGARYGAWSDFVERPRFAASALNLAHYLSVRSRDLRVLQRRLMPLGVSSLGRLEGRTLAAIDAVSGALAGLAGVAMPQLPTERQFFRGERRLAENTDEAFGPMAAGRPGRILVTLPAEAAEDPALIASIAASGADLVRINCAHDGPEAWAAMIAHVRAARTPSGAPLRVLMDIAGPKVRTGDVVTPEGQRRVYPGDELLLCRALEAGASVPFRFTCTEPAVLDRIGVGTAVSIDDGALEGEITAAGPEGFRIAIARGKVAGVKLKSEKGLNFPGTDLGLDPLTDKDRQDLDFIVGHADLIGYSFVQTAGHVAALQAELAQRTPGWRTIPLVGKIETPLAVRNLPEIIVQAAGRQPFAVMIARGDLAVEMGFERVAEMQEEILWICEAAHVPVIWATQVLEGLVKTGVPTRGEMTDAAMAARTECVMLNKGPNAVAAVALLDRLLRRMVGHQTKKTPTLRALRAWEDPRPAPPIPD